MYVIGFGPVAGTWWDVPHVAQPSSVANFGVAGWYGDAFVPLPGVYGFAAVVAAVRVPGGVHGT
jgi:hypothetical protein